MWLQVTEARPDSEVRLVCFPHAGGTAKFYAPWAAALDRVEVHSVAYPGRAERIEDELATDLVVLAGQIAEAIGEIADRRIALFGHSLGAAVALETARVLEHAGVEVDYLFASGSRNAPLPAKLDPPSEDPAEVIEQLVRLGGTDPELARDPVFQELVIPYVLGDDKMFHSYPMSPTPVLRCPVTTIVGIEDENADCRPWSELTHSQFIERHVPGNHFYLVDTPPWDIVARSLFPSEPEEQI
ncbi:thioesterase II family protein [Streptomyces sp. NPDC001142]